MKSVRAAFLYLHIFATAPTHRIVGHAGASDYLAVMATLEGTWGGSWASAVPRPARRLYLLVRGPHQGSGMSFAPSVAWVIGAT